MRFLFLLLTIFCAISFFVDDAIAQSLHNKELTDEIFPRTEPETIKKKSGSSTLVRQIIRSLILISY